MVFQLIILDRGNERIQEFTAPLERRRTVFDDPAGNGQGTTAETGRSDKLADAVERRVRLMRTPGLPPIHAAQPVPGRTLCLHGYAAAPGQ